MLTSTTQSKLQFKKKPILTVIQMFILINMWFKILPFIHNRTKYKQRVSQ